MNISSRCEYAWRAVVELASRFNDREPISALEIATRRHIPEKYLVHILLELKRAGLVRSVRGAQGGYHIAKSPAEITLYDVVRAIDGPVLDPLPAGDGSADLRPIWSSVARDIETVLQGATAQDAIDLNAGGHMYHI